MSSDFTIFRYPEDDPSPLQAFSVECPDGWAVQDAPGGLVVFAEATSAMTFRANVMVCADRVAVGISLNDVASTTLSQARLESTDYQLIDEKAVDANGDPGLLRISTFVASPLTIFQMQLLVLGDTIGVHTKTLFHLICSCSADESELYAETFGAVGRSFRLRKLPPSAADSSAG
jgi:hypothetical protein